MYSNICLSKLIYLAFSCSLSCVHSNLIQRIAIQCWMKISLKNCQPSRSWAVLIHPLPVTFFKSSVHRVTGRLTLRLSDHYNMIININNERGLLSVVDYGRLMILKNAWLFLERLWVAIFLTMHKTFKKIISLLQSSKRIEKKRKEIIVRFLV